ncbi:MAG: hemolysin III family protein [Acidobacteria bacterium]|nr:hemolysin III family protein [Acidobacteriota bacterium]
MIRAHISEMSVEEVANTLTHGLGLVLSLAGFVFLVSLAFLYGDTWHIVSSLIYGSSLVVLYAASTFYHTVIDPNRKQWLQLADHCCIYLLIAGTYTPFLLTVLRNVGGNEMMAFIWGFAAVGIALKIVFRERLKALGIVFYLLMGWIGILGMKPIYEILGLVPMLLVAGGGISYTMGMIFFGWHRIPHNHAIFHVFVLGGSILHYIAIVMYLVPRA